MADDVIQYDPETKKAGNVLITPGSKKLEEADRQTLLYLIFHLIYTKAGRDLFIEHAPPLDGDASAAVAGVITAIGAEFPLLKDASFVPAIASAHVAGFRFAKLSEQGGADPAKLKALEAEYKKHLKEILRAGELTALAHEFSINW